MTLFFCHCPDYANAQDKRQAARERHLAMGRESRANGTIVFGRAFLEQSDRSMAGSNMLYRFPTLDAAWERIKSDPYWLDGVWDKEKCRVMELPAMEGDDSLRLVVA